DAEGRLTGGFNVELARLLCQRMGRPCSLEKTGFPQLLTRIEEGTFQIGFANLLKNAEREQKMLFSAPIWRSTSSFVSRAGSPVVDPAKARRNGRICVVHKSQQEAFIADQPGPQAHLVPTASHADLFDALTNGRCDAALLPTVHVLSFLASPAGSNYDYSGPPLQEPRLSGNVHIVVAKSRPELLDSLNAAIAAINRDGSYRALIARFFPFDIL
ncbi:MAG: substrate-binding periplasmic protein, partial [Magnetospirillum sp.]